MSGLRVNLGCGATPTPGFTNLDNSPTLHLSRWPKLVVWLESAHLISAKQAVFARLAAERGIRHGSAAKLPLPSGSVELLYSSHMIEHLAYEAVDLFLAEALRVLQPGGFLRLAFPDLRRMAQRYMADGDAEAFMVATGLAREHRATPLRRLQAAIIGFRGHRWMYDAASMSHRLNCAGFVDVCQPEAGTTSIPDAGDLDLREREDDSAYVEGRKP
jgi:predicted SAM-dependent methyltransferase